MYYNSSSGGSPAVLLVEGVSKDVKLRYHQLCCVCLQLWTIYQECLYQRCFTLDTAHGLMR